MAITVNFVGENVVEIPGAVRVTDLGGGEIKIKLLTNPNATWVDQDHKKIPSGTGLTIGGKPDPFVGVFEGSDEWRDDPHSYLNGSRMSIKESTLRATNRVYNEYSWWGTHADFRKGSKKDLAKIVRHLIRDGKGRDEVYRLGGKAVTFYKNGSFDRYSLVELFELAALYDRVIDTPILDG